MAKSTKTRRFLGSSAGLLALAGGALGSANYLLSLMNQRRDAAAYPSQHHQRKYRAGMRKAAQAHAPAYRSRKGTNLTKYGRVRA